MNRNSILNEVIEFTKIVNDSLDNKESKEFNVNLKVSIQDNLNDKYKFLDKIINICHRKKIEVPKCLGEFLLYDEDLQKDIIYSFILNSSIKSKNKVSNI